MDADLNSLLDDALTDFDKHTPSKKQTEDKTKKVEAAKQNDHATSTFKPGTSGGSMGPPTDIFKEFFGDETTMHLQEEWHQAIKELGSENPELMEEMKKLSETTTPFPTFTQQEATASPGSSQKADFSQSMQAALESLSLNADKKGSEKDEEDLLKGFLDFGATGEAGDPMDMMENIMKSMLSKDMLYPPMKEMSKQYPPWLKKNGDKIPKKEKDNYVKQLTCLETVCKEFESEKDSDSEEVKKERFVRVMDVVHEMQGYGQPPEELLDQGGPLPSPDSCVVS